MEEVEQQEAVATAGDDQDQDFASCPREDDDQEDLHPPYGLLDDVTGLGPERDDRETEARGEATAGAADTRADQDRLASLRFQMEDADQVARPPVQVSSPGSRVADSRSATGAEDVAGQIQQLISVVGVLASRLERVEAASTSDSSSGSQWRPRSDTVNLGYVDNAALDRWYAQAVQECTGPAGDIGGCPPMPPPGPTGGSGMEFLNPWFSGPAGWFRQVGNWLGLRGFGSQG